MTIDIKDAFHNMRPFYVMSRDCVMLDVGEFSIGCILSGTDMMARTYKSSQSPIIVAFEI